MIALPAATTNNTQNDWTAPDLPDDCSSALEIYYCSPSSGATVPSSTVLPTTCSRVYWIGLLSSTAAEPTTTTTAGPPGPTQSGEPSNGDAWYLVQAGDTCSAVVAKYGNFTLAQFYG